MDKMTMMAKPPEILKALEENDTIGLTFILRSKTELNAIGIEIFQGDRRLEKLLIEAQRIQKQINIETQYQLQRLSDYQREKLQCMIVNNIDGEEEQEYDQEE